MADTKISALPASTTPLAGTEVLPIVQGGVTKQVSVTNLTSGKIVPANGIQFPAIQVTSADPNALDDYEEGTWTPIIEGTTTAGIGVYVVQSGRYTKIGNRVLFDCRAVWSAHTGTGNMFLAGFPFTPALVFRGIPAITFDITQTAGKAPCIIFGSGSFTKANVAEYGNSGAYANIAMDISGEIIVNGSYEV
jgi:hypothetical protein